jgi:hypothetical protein
MNSLNGKKVLLIAARFFGYEEEIRAKLKMLGVDVHYFDQRPSNSFLVKGLIRINKHFLANTIRKYYGRLIEKTKSIQYDYVLFISPEAITKTIFLQLKQAQPQACFILYMWDSFKNKSNNVKDILPHFDKRFSFDRQDCEIPEIKIHYRPLFFLNDYSAISTSAEKEYDLLFIGTIHSDRYKILSRLREICNENGLRYFYYLYFPSKILFYLRRLKDASLRKADIREFNFTALAKAEILKLAEKSKAVIDIQHPKQNGLTIRTMEVLGARRKLLSTNEDIVNYDFFHANNIYVLDRNAIKIDLSFMDKPIVPIRNDIYNKYSIDGWIKEIFSLNEGIEPVIAR